MALATIQRILRANDVIVVGSAPLQPEVKALAEDPTFKLICVNGSISNVNRVPDVWVLNSRNYSDPVYTNTELWPEDRRKLHDIMMQQAYGKSARHILFFLKNDTPADTIQRLQDSGCTWRAHSTLHAGMRTDLIRKAGVHRFSTAFNVSAGLTGACIALAYKAKSVTLVGFSLDNPNYSYLTTTPPDTRKHLPQDTEALSELQAKHPHFRVLFS